jgi:hypothetical protein
MSTKIGLKITGRMFDVDVDDKFASFLENQMEKDFNIDGNNDVKMLLRAYVRKTHTLYLQEEKMEEILKNIDL